VPFPVSWPLPRWAHTFRTLTVGQCTGDVRRLWDGPIGDAGCGIAGCDAADAEQGGRPGAVAGAVVQADHSQPVQIRGRRWAAPCSHLCSRTVLSLVLIFMTMPRRWSGIPGLVLLCCLKCRIYCIMYTSKEKCSSRGFYFDSRDTLYHLGRVVDCIPRM